MQNAPVASWAPSGIPVVVECPYCKMQTTTRIEQHVGSRASLWSCVCCLLLGPCAAVVPCLMRSCKDTQHYCSRCGRLLAVEQ